MSLHINSVFLLSFLFDLFVAADFSETQFNINVCVTEDLKKEEEG